MNSNCQEGKFRLETWIVLGILVDIQSLEIFKEGNKLEIQESYTIDSLSS